MITVEKAEKFAALFLHILTALMLSAPPPQPRWAAQTTDSLGENKDNVSQRL